MQHYKVEPYVVCADIYGAPPHTGRGGWTWYTGSAGWLYRVGLEAILGVRPSGDTLRFEPCIPCRLAGIRGRLPPWVRDVPDPGGEPGRRRPRRAVGPGGRAAGAGRRRAVARRRDASMTSACPWVARRGEPWPTHHRPRKTGIGCRPTRDLDRLQWTTILYYLHETNPDNGLVRDKTDPAAPCSIAAVGMALATLPVVVERGVLFRPFAAKLALRRLRFLHDLPQGPEPDASGYKGFFYHFLDIETGRRVWQCELSTIDSAFLFAGMLTAAAYFDHDTADEAEVRRLADALYRRADWNWARNGGATLTHGWRPETGFLPYRWEGYDEGLLLYVLGLGSPTYPLPPESYAAFCSTYEWKQLYGRELLYSGPLFTHQLSHLWIDFRGLRDAFMRDHGSDYFENSRQATFVQQAYAVAEPAAIRRLRGALLGVHGLRRPRLGEAGRGRGGAAVLRLHRPRRPVRPRRRHRRPVGRGRLAAVRPGDRHSDRLPPGRPEAGRPGPAVRIQAVVQPDVPRG